MESCPPTLVLTLLVCKVSEDGTTNISSKLSHHVFTASHVTAKHHAMSDKEVWLLRRRDVLLISSRRSEQCFNISTQIATETSISLSSPGSALRCELGQLRRRAYTPTSVFLKLKPTFEVRWFLVSSRHRQRAQQRSEGLLESAVPPFPPLLCFSCERRQIPSMTWKAERARRGILGVEGGR